MCPVQAGGAHRSSAVITGPMIYFSSNRSEDLVTGLVVYLSSNRPEGPVTGLVVYLSSNRPEDPLTGLMVDFSPSLELVSGPTIYFSISFRGIIYFPWHRQIEETDRVESLYQRRRQTGLKEITQVSKRPQVVSNLPAPSPTDS